MARKDPTGWVYKAEKYFDFQNVAPGQQMQLASFTPWGHRIFQWHRWLMKFRWPLTWDEFTEAIFHHFCRTDYEEPSEALIRLKQATSVEAYQEVFQKLSHGVEALPENFLIGCFIVDLQGDIRLDVKVKQSRSVADAIGVAKLIGEWNQLQWRRIGLLQQLGLGPSPKHVENPSVGLLGLPPMVQPPPQSSMGFKQFTGQEAEEQRAKVCVFTVMNITFQAITANTLNFTWLMRHDWVS